MAVGSVVMWLGLPLGWLFVASRLSGSSRPSMAVYVLVLAAIALSIAAMGKLLAGLDRAYGRLECVERPAGRAAWLRSMRDDRERRRGTVLDIVMAWSVGLALLAFGLWFFLFAGSSLPG